MKSVCFRSSVLAVALGLALSAHAASDVMSAPRMAAVSQRGTVVDGFIITYKPGSNEANDRQAALQNISAAVARAGLRAGAASAHGAPMAPLEMRFERRLAAGGDLVKASRRLDAAEANTLMLQIAADPAVQHVEPNVRMHAVRDVQAPVMMRKQAPLAFTPNDPYYAKYQWDYNDPIGGANIANAWDLADGNGVTVAVLDTGITKHPDLDTSLADAGYDFVSDKFLSGRDADGRVAGGWDTGDWTTGTEYQECWYPGTQGDPSSWHGTHVSGTVSELTNNGIGFAGIAHKAKVLPVRVLGHCGGDTADIADAIVWASGGHVDGVPDNEHPAQVINMSLGGDGSCPADSVMGRAITDAIDRGTTVVVAAGNDTDDVRNHSPANCAGVIAVGSNGITGRRAFYSNYGGGITLSAPGGGIYPNDGSSGSPVDNGFIWSTVNAGKTVPGDAAYGGMAGTSQATPHVAGTLALMISAAKEAGLDAPTPAKLRSYLTSTARAFPVQLDHPLGAGILDAAAAVNAALGNDNGGGDEDVVVPLQRGAVVGGQSAATGKQLLFSIDVPANARNLNLRTLGGTGNATLFVKAGSAPDQDGSGADFVSDKPGNNEAIVISRPQATTYYLRVVAKTGFDNLSVLATYTP